MGVPAGATCRSGDPRALTPRVEVTLLRVAQEALANVGKHAAASQRLGDAVRNMEDVVTLDVRDDGVPDPPCLRERRRSRPATGAAGGSPPRRRVRADRDAAAGEPAAPGQLEIESEPGAGTAVSASLPAIGLAPPPQAAMAEEPS